METLENKPKKRTSIKKIVLYLIGFFFAFIGILLLYDSFPWFKVFFAYFFYMLIPIVIIFWVIKKILDYIFKIFI